MYLDLRVHVGGDLAQLRHPPSASVPARSMSVSSDEGRGYDDWEVMISHEAYRRMISVALTVCISSGVSVMADSV